MRGRGGGSFQSDAKADASLIRTVLYPVILASFGFVFLQAFRLEVLWGVALPFALNPVANLLFMPISSGLRSVPLAAADIVVVWATILCCVFAVWPHYKWVGVAQVPDLVWVSFATAVQMSITWPNQ